MNHTTIELVIAFCVGIVVGLIWGIIFIRTPIYSEAKKAGAGTYYLDANDCKQWKWTGAQVGTK